MAAYICTRCALRQPAMEASLRTTTTRSFSATPTTHYPRENAGKRFLRRDANRMRGVSALRGTGLNPRTTLSVKLKELAVPVEEKDRTPLKVDENHGLWHFFGRDRTKSIMTPSELSHYGRHWSPLELERKSFDDLHTLWWLCVRERNRLYTDSLERARLRAGYGEDEYLNRDLSVQKTMRNIREVLEKRVYAWEDARTLVETDDEIELVDGELVYTPRQLKVEDVYEAEEKEESRERRPKKAIESTAAVDSVTSKPTEQATPTQA